MKAKGSRWIVVVISVSVLVPLVATGLAVYVGSRSPSAVVADAPRFFEDASSIGPALQVRFGQVARLTRLAVYESRVELDAIQPGGAELGRYTLLGGVIGEMTPLRSEGLAEDDVAEDLEALVFSFGEADAVNVPKLLRLAQGELELDSAKPSRLVLERRPMRGSEPVWTVHFERPGGVGPLVFSRSGARLREE